MVVEEAMPTALSLTTSRAGIPFLLIISSGSQHFNIYKGLFMKSAHRIAVQYIYIPDVPFGAAMKTCPDSGDDTLHTPHAPLPTYRIPDFIVSRAPDVDVGGDLIFVDFFGAQLIRTLNAMQTACVVLVGRHEDV
ncbi:hypothetical protein B0H14DRAFT_3644550 [Mycena olivaceomarginata]|nr:hypothetical protein B0H14DRAFT_3644550 [Mycena olivaceomarginata]